MEYYSVIKRNKTVPFTELWMDLETQSEKLRKRKIHIVYCLYVASRKMI